MTTCPRCGAVKPAAVDVCIWCAAELGHNVQPGSPYAEGFSFSGPGLGPRWYPDNGTGPGVRPAGPNGEPPAPPPRPTPSLRPPVGAPPVGAPPVGAPPVAAPAAGAADAIAELPGRTPPKAWPWVVGAAVALVAVLALLLGTGVLPLPGRGAISQPGAPTPPGPSTGPDTDPPGTAIGAADPAGLTAGSTLRAGGYQLPMTSMDPLDPGFYTPQLGRDQDVLRASFPVFVRFDGSGQPSWDPAYVTGAEVLSAEPTKVRIDLNPKAVWGDGTPLQAAHVAEVWRRCTSSASCAHADAWSRVSEVREGSGPQQVVVDYQSADGEWQRPFAYISAIRPEAPRGGSDWQQPPAAWQCGPFLIEKADLKAAGSSVLLRANPAWWGDPPRLSRIEFGGNDVVGTRLAAGQFDVAELGSGADFAAGRRAGEIRMVPSGVRRQLMLNPRIELKVRQAIQLTLDRPSLARAGTAGLPEPVPLNNAVLLTNQAGYLAQTPARDIARARDLMAGRTDAGPLRLRMLTSTTGTPFFTALPNEVASQLREIGIEVEIERVPFADYGRRRDDGDFDMMAMGWIDDQFVASTAQWLYGSSGSSRVAVTDPAIGGLLDRARGTSEESLRSKLLNEVDSSLQSQATVIPLYQDQEIVVATPKLANYGAFGLATVDWTRVGFRS